MKIQKRYPGTRGAHAALARGRSPPPPGAGDVSSALASGRGPLAYRGLLADAPLWRVAGAPRPPGAGVARAALARGRSPPAEKTVFVKHQPKLYLVDV